MLKHKRLLGLGTMLAAVIGATALFSCPVPVEAAGLFYVPFKTNNWSVSTVWSCSDPARPWTSHCAWDLYAPANTSAGTQVTAAAAGTAYVHTDSYLTEDNECLPGESWGRWVEIRHANGLRTYYAHLKAFKIANNVPVAAGQVIGIMGNSGCAFGPHVHFEVHNSSGTAINPGNPESCSTSCSLWLGCPRADVAPPRPPDTGSGAQAGYDINGDDSLTDLFLYNGGGGSGKATGVVLFANGSGGWKNGPYNSTFSANWQVYPGKFNNDSLTDLFLYNGDGGSGKATGVVLFANGSGGWKNGPYNRTFDANWQVYPGKFGRS